MKVWELNEQMNVLIYEVTCNLKNESKWDFCGKTDPLSKKVIVDLQILISLLALVT